MDRTGARLPEEEEDEEEEEEEKDNKNQGHLDLVSLAGSFSWSRVPVLTGRGQSLHLARRQSHQHRQRMS